MSTENLDRLLSAAKEFDGSDLHLVTGVPPAFRVNGEIIIADEDALTEDEYQVTLGEDLGPHVHPHVAGHGHGAAGHGAHADLAGADVQELGAAVDVPQFKLPVRGLDDEGVPDRRDHRATLQGERVGVEPHRVERTHLRHLRQRGERLARRLVPAIHR